MAHIFPFKALLPSEGLELVVSANIHIDDINRQKAIVDGNPLTYLNVVRPYLRLNEPKDPSKHFPLAHSALLDLIEKKALKYVPDEAVFIYRQTNLKTGDTFLGLICGVSCDDYFNGHIRKHENTLTEKEMQLISHIEYTHVIGEPVLLTHRTDQTINALLEDCLPKGELIMDFDDEYGYKHRVCMVTDSEIIQTFKKAYQTTGDLYIADGHHRSAASAGYFEKNKIQNGKYLAYIVPPEYLKIESFHRAYKCDGEFDFNVFMDQMKEDFEVRLCNEPHKSLKEREFGLYAAGNWYIVTYSKQCDGLNAVDTLDVSLLERHVFGKILNIEDSKTDKQLDFLRGGVSLKELESMVNSGKFDLVFTVFPCTIQEVFEVADNKLIMPPKSTYIEPKMRTGLFIQKVTESI